MKIIDSLWGYLFNKKEEDDELNEELDASYIEDFENFPKAQITFLVGHDDNIDISFVWDGEEGTAHVLGTLLFDMNAGNLTELITGILTNQMDEEPESKEFIKTIVLRWESLIKKKNKMLAAPAVHALKTFGASKT